MRSAANTSSFRSSSLSSLVRSPRALIAAMFVLALAACGGSEGTAGTSTSGSAKPDAGTSATGAPSSSSNKDDGDVRYAP
jgi:hypothetical protein